MPRRLWCWWPKIESCLVVSMYLRDMCILCSFLAMGTWLKKLKCYGVAFLFATDEGPKFRSARDTSNTPSWISALLGYRYAPHTTRDLSASDLNNTISKCRRWKIYCISASWTNMAAVRLVSRPNCRSAPKRASGWEGACKKTSCMISGMGFFRIICIVPEQITNCFTRGRMRNFARSFPTLAPCVQSPLVETDIFQQQLQHHHRP